MIDDPERPALCPEDHEPRVITTRRPRDWFRRRYWVRCWKCDLRLGPYRYLTVAHAAARGTVSPRGQLRSLPTRGDSARITP
jgi:hypothetical protein